MFNLQATFLSNFASGLLWHRSDHPIPLVVHALGSQKRQNVSLFRSSCMAQFLLDLFDI